MNKIKKILDSILNFLKKVLAFIFEGIFKIFASDKNSKELKPIKINNENINLEKDINSTDFSSYHSEDAESIVLNKDNSLVVTLDTLEKLIKVSFCEELEIEEKDLSKNEEEYIKNINEKIIPTINENIKNEYIISEEKLTLEIKRLVKEELETQYKLEKTNKIPAEKIIIIPLLVDRKTVVNKPKHTEPTFLESKLNEISVEEKPEVSDAITIDNTPINDNIVSGDFTIDKTYEVKDLDNNDINKKDIEYIDTYIDSIENEAVINDNLSPEIKEVSDSLDNEAKIDMTTATVSISNNLTPTSVHIEIMEEALNDLNKPLNFEKNEKLEKVETYDFRDFDSLTEKVISTYNLEIKKENLEDKNYELIENLIQDLLEKLEKLKLKNIDSLTRDKLIKREEQLIVFRDNLYAQKQKDISMEESILEEDILISDLNALELELQKIHVEEKLDLQEYMLNSLEDLDNLTIEKSKLIEKELLKKRLKKALKGMEISSLLALPFIRNKYFLYFTLGLFTNKHLKLFDSILKRQTLEYEPANISHIKTGAHALEDAIGLINQNIEYLNFLENETFRKHPDLKFDIHFLNDLNGLKIKLLNKQERLLKKEKMIKKHNLKLKKRIRKLKKQKKEKNS